MSSYIRTSDEAVERYKRELRESGGEKKQAEEKESKPVAVAEAPEKRRKATYKLIIENFRKICGKRRAKHKRKRVGNIN